MCCTVLDSSVEDISRHCTELPPKSQHVDFHRVSIFAKTVWQWLTAHLSSLKYNLLLHRFCDAVTVSWPCESYLYSLLVLNKNKTKSCLSRGQSWKSKYPPCLVSQFQVWCPQGEGLHWERETLQGTLQPRCASRVILEVDEMWTLKWTGKRVCCS